MGSIKELKEKFVSFVRKHPKSATLKETVENSNPKHMILLCTNLANVNGPSYFRLAMEGCQNWSDSDKCLQLKTSLMQKALENVMENVSNSTEEENCQTFVDIILTTLDVTIDLPARSLALLVECCVKELESHHRPLNSSWLAVFAKLITVGGDCLSMVVDSEDPGNTLEGKLWRKNLIRKLCINNWRDEDSTAIVKMFSEVSDLETDEMDMIVEKACTMLTKINRSEESGPPLLFQLLLLTRSYAQNTFAANSTSNNVFGRIIQTLSKHYNKNHEKVLQQAGQSTLDSADMIDEGVSSEAYQRSECIVIFHLVHAIKMGHPIGREIVKLLRSSSQLPDVIFANPFNMFIGLAVTSIKNHHTVAVECIKTATCKNIQLQLKRDESAWFRQTVPFATDPKILFGHLIEQSTTFGGWDMIGAGLIEVAMCLLDSSCSLSTMKPKVSKISCTLGNEIVKLVNKRRSASILPVLRELTRRILSSKGAIQYTNCLRTTIKDGLTVIMEEPPVFMNELLDHFGALGINGSKRVLVSLMPLIKHGSPSLRNATILTLRKSLFAPNLETRRIAVAGVLQLLKYFRITSAMPITQMIMSQSSSCLSQAVVNVHQGGTTNNETLCLELMGVLKRGLSQQAAVRMSLYQGLHDVVGRNPELCVGVLDMLYSHAIELKITSEDAVNPIDIDSMIAKTGNDVFIIEPVGWFLHCVQLMVGKANHLYGDENMEQEEIDTASLLKLTDLLNRLAKIYADNLDTMDLNFEKGSDYSKATAAGRYNILRVETYKNIYESLMDYTIMHGAGVKDDKAGLLVRLQFRHAEMGELVKKKPMGQDKTHNRTKAGKEKNKKAPAKEKGTMIEHSELTQNKNENVPGTSFTPTPQHAFSLKGISNILHSILNDNKPSNHGAVSQLRVDLSFQSYFLKVLLEKIHQLDKTLSASGDGEAKDVVLKHLSTIASTLAEHCLINPEADEGLLPQSIECFLKCLKLVGAHFYWNYSEIESFYGRIYSNSTGIGKSSKINLTKIISELIDKVIQKLKPILEDEQSANDEELEGLNRKKVLEHLFQILTYLCKEIDIYDVLGETTTKNAAKWIRNCLENCGLTEPNTLKLFLEVFYACHIRTKSSDTIIIKELAQEIHSKVGDIDTLQVESLEKFSFVTAQTSEIIFHQTANYLEYSLELADSIIGRCKQIAINRDSGLTSTEGTVG